MTDDGAPDVVTFGETMGLVAATSTGPFAAGAPARISFAGAESNVAIGLARLGHSTAWLGRLGTDPLGALVTTALRGEGVDVSGVRLEPDLPTGLLLREHRTADRVRVSYYRRDLAGSRISPDDVGPGLISGARILHLTGITPALSPSARQAVHRAADAAASAGVLVSLDLNYRSALWSRTEAARELTALAGRADLVFGGPEEIALVVDPAANPESEPEVGAGGHHGSESVPEPEPSEAVAERLARRLAGPRPAGRRPGGPEGRPGQGHGPAQVVVKLAERGALALVDGRAFRVPGLPVTCVDPVGAGDAFVAGYLSGLLDGLAPEARLVRANTCGAYAVSVAGDWEGLPRRSELETLSGSDNVGR